MIEWVKNTSLNLEDKFDQVTINRVIDNAKNAYQEAESHKL